MPDRINPDTRFYPIWIAVLLMVGAFAYWSGMHAVTPSPPADACVEAFEQLSAVRKTRGPTEAELANLNCKPNQTVTRR